MIPRLHPRKILVFGLLAFAMTLSLGGAVYASTSTPDAHASHHSDATPSTSDVCASPAAATPAKPAMMGGNAAPGMQMNQEFDLMFIDMMIPHHESAIAMAQIALIRGEHPEIRDLAQRIITSQQAEIAQMKAWRDAWYPGAAAMPVDQMDTMMGGMMDEMSGMMGTPLAGMGSMFDMAGKLNPAGEASALCAISGSFDEAFIQMMIPHHQGAVAMAGVALQKATHPEIRTLATTIIAAQQKEITDMTGWLLSWYDATPTAG